MLELSQLLPAGEVELEFLDVVMSERGTELAAKFQRETDGQWLASYIAEVAKPGEELPYHPNFGLSEDEYIEALAAARDMKLRPVGVTWKCLIKREGAVISFEPIGHRSPRLASIRLQLDSHEAETAGVNLGQGEWRWSSGEDAAIGPWRGYLWKKESGNESELLHGGDFQTVTLDVLHLTGSDYVSVGHKFIDRRNGGRPVSQEFMFRFKVPGLK